MSQNQQIAKALAAATDTAALEIVLAFRDISCVIRYRVSYVVTRHRRYAEDGDGSRAFDIYCLFC